MFTYYIFHIFLNFLELFHFLKITRKRSGFLRIQEISFKVETLNEGTCTVAMRLDVFQMDENEKKTHQNL